MDEATAVGVDLAKATATLLAIAAVVLTATSALTGIASAQDVEPSRAEPDTSVDDERRLALNIFGLSLHTGRDEGHNEINPGLGLRYAFWQPAPRWTLFSEAGIYYDSTREWAKYVALGTLYRFAPRWSIGAALAYGQSQGYKDGEPFFALVPGVAFEYRRVAINLVLLPAAEDGSGIQGVATYLTIPLHRRARP